MFARFYVVPVALGFFPSLFSDSESSPVVDETVSHPSAIIDTPNVADSGFLNNLFEKEHNLNGILLVGSEKEIVHDEKSLSKVKGIEARSVFVPGGVKKLSDEIWNKIASRALDASTIEEVQRLVNGYYEKEQYPFVILSIPSQRIQEGVLQIVVEMSRVGVVAVEGASWESADRVKKIFSVRPGAAIDQGKVLKGLNFLNKNPFRQADLVYSQGSEEKTTNLNLVIQEKFPWRIYSGIDNTGVLSTGRNRFFSGFNWGNAFKRGDLISGQYTASFDVRDFQAGTVQYLSFWESQTTLNVYGGYSTTHADLPFPNMRNHGQSYQGSIRYAGSLSPTPRMTQELEVGFDLKSTNNTVEFVEQFPIFSNWVNLTQLEMGYSVEIGGPSYSASVKSRLFVSPCAWIPHQSNNDFASLRRGAKNHWVYLSGLWDFTKRYSRFGTFSFFGQYHWSSESLLPSEQLGIGGYDTVRGYEERQFNADTGIIGSLEYRTPSFPLLTAFKKNRKFRDSLLFLLFSDFGYGKNHSPPFPGQKKQYLASIGPGVRYFIGSYLSLRCDWGFRLHNMTQFQGDSNLFHFGLVASF